MDYWPSVTSRWLDIGQVLYLQAYGPRRSRGPSTRKKMNQAILTEQARSIKDLLYGSPEIFLMKRGGNPECARELHLAHLGSQSKHRIWFILLAREASHIIPWVIDRAWGQDGWILATSFFVCLWTKMELRSINMEKEKKKECGQYPPFWATSLGQ